MAEHGGPGIGKEFLTSKRKAKVWRSCFGCALGDSRKTHAGSVTTGIIDCCVPQITQLVDRYIKNLPP